MSAKHITLALIGAGGIGSRWVDAISKVRSVSLELIIDRDINKAKKLVASVKHCQASNNLNDILLNPNIDAAVVAVPHKFLADISRKLLLAKKHVLCEKPGGINLQEIRSVMAASRKSSCNYMVGFNHRFHKGFLMAKNLYEGGTIGKILFIRARYGFGGREEYNKEWRFDKKISGGGELIDQGVHMIDLARWFLGDFKNIKGFAPNLFWGGDVEDNGFMLLKTPQGQVASIHVSWTNWKWIHSFEIVGSKGYLYIDGLDQKYGGPERLTIGRRDLSFKKPPTEKVVVFKSELSQDSFIRELKEFINSIYEKREPLSSGQDAYQILKIVKKIYGQN